MMKKYVFLTLFLPMCIGSFQAKEVMNNRVVVAEYRIDTEYVPKAAKKHIKNNYPEAYDIKWDYKKGEALYKSEFKVKGEKYKLIFTPKGKLIYFKGNVAASELPSKIKRYIKKYYSDHQIVRVGKVQSFKNVTYDVKIGGQNYGKFQNKTIRFDQKGNILN